MQSGRLLIKLFDYVKRKITGINRIMNEFKLKFKHFVQESIAPYLRKAIEFHENEFLNTYSLSITHGSYLFYIKSKKNSGESKTDKEEELAETFEEEKRHFLEFLVKNSSNYFKQKKEEIKQYLNELKINLQSYLGNRGLIREIEMKLTYRGAFGVSSTFGQIPFEVGLYIHPYFNVPYIPASSIKGAIRNGYYCYLINNKEKSEGEAEAECNKIFGDGNFAGLVGFTDAFPVQEGENGYILYPDIINPHYKDVINEMEVEPKPIVFLTVAPGTTFKFFMYIIKEREKKKGEKRTIEIGEGKELANKPVPDKDKLGILDLALLYGLSMGIGAKTALGYSQFLVITYE